MALGLDTLPMQSNQGPAGCWKSIDRAEPGRAQIEARVRGLLRVGPNAPLSRLQHIVWFAIATGRLLCLYYLRPSASNTFSCWWRPR